MIRRSTSKRIDHLCPGASRPVLNILNKQGVSSSYMTTERMVKNAGNVHDKMAVYLKEKVEKNEPVEISEVSRVQIYRKSMKQG